MQIIIEKLRDLKEQFSKFRENNGRYDRGTYNTMIDRVQSLTKKQFGENNEYLERLEQFKNNDSLASIRSNDLENLNIVIDMIIDSIELDMKKSELITNPIEQEKKTQEITKEIEQLNKKVFIVHGHNETMKQTVARVIEKLKLDPVILHEQSNEGNTIIEKFISHSSVGYAIVLLSADDIGYSVKDGKEHAKKRARQNVILELGYFLAKLGRNRVIALVEDIEEFEIPSDYNGVIYIPFDSKGKWKLDVLREFNNSGYNIDANRIL